MKIRIIKADKTKWYADKIGKVYVVKKIYKLVGKEVFIIRNYRTILRTINVNDAEIVDELHEVVENLKAEIFKSFKIPQIVKWLNKKLK